MGRTLGDRNLADLYTYNQYFKNANINWGYDMQETKVSGLENSI